MPDTLLTSSMKTGSPSYDTLYKTKGFYANVIVNNNNLVCGDIAYLKATTFKFSTPTGYDILDHTTGKTLAYISANDFINWFEYT